MLCYRDMTFCTYWKDCAAAKDCGRPWTEKVQEEADKWWGEPGAPICVYTEKPDCHKPVNEE